MSDAAINALLARLESVANRLESVEKQLAAGGGPSSSGGAAAAGPSAASVDAYGSLITQYIDDYVNLSGKLDPLVKKQADLVKRAVEAQKQMIRVASQSKKPSDSVLGNLLKPTADLMGEINSIRDSNRASQWFNHLSTISEGISALAWVTVSPTPGPHVDDARASSEFYSNKLLMQYRKDTSAAAQTHVNWVTAWNTFLKDLRAYIKQYHTTELTWNPQGGDASAAAGSSGGSSSSGGGGAPAPPPPPPTIDVASLSGGGGAESGAGRNALLAEINAVKDRQTGGRTEGLRHVTKDMKTKYQTEAPPPVQPKAKPAPSRAAAASSKAPGGPPKLALEGNKWVVEYQHNNKSVVIDNPEPKHTVYIYKCENSVVQIKGKVNAITIDTCKKTGIVFDNAISVAEAVNCSSIQIQCTGKVPAVQVDKTSGCQIFLSNEGLGVEIVTSKSDELNVCLPGKTPSDDMTEIAIPEQFKTTINPATRSLSTEAVAHV